MSFVTTRSDIRYQDYLVTGPSIEPLDLEEVKKQRRFSATSLDTLFDVWMSAARMQFEEETGLQLMTAMRCFALDATPCDRVIELGRAPVQSIDSVVYDDADGVEQTFSADNYRLSPPTGTGDTYPVLGKIELMPGASWPSVGTLANALRINYWAGYGSARGAVPEIIRFALMMFVGSFHQYGEEVQETTNILATMPLGAQRVIGEAKWRTLRTLVPRRW